MSGATVLMLPAALWLDRPWALSPSWPSLAALALLAIVCTALAMIIFFRLVRTLGSLGTNSGSYLRAGFSVLLGAVLLGESFTWSTFAGMVLILLGIAAINAPWRRAGHR